MILAPCVLSLDIFSNLGFGFCSYHYQSGNQGTGNVEGKQRQV